MACGCGPLALVYRGDGESLDTTLPEIDLPERLRLGTRDLHAAAERSGLMAELLAGRIRRPAYLRLLRNLHAIYEALEATLPLAFTAAAPGLPLAALGRAGALAADLATLHGPLWRTELPLEPAAAAYVQRIEQLAAATPRRLLAHAYLRYLGDLHGGQLLRRQVGRALGEDASLAFYDFGPPEQVLALRLRLREVLAALAPGESEAQAMVDEARWGFEQHRCLFDALASASA